MRKGEKKNNAYIPTESLEGFPSSGPFIQSNFSFKYLNRNLRQESFRSKQHTQIPYLRAHMPYRTKCFLITFSFFFTLTIIAFFTHVRMDREIYRSCLCLYVLNITSF